MVTSRKFTERLVDVPIAISVFSNDDLTRRGAGSIADVLQTVPGVSVYDAGSGVNKISIRGISTSLGGNENGYYLDD
ncbi:MAG TPA: Plug domain-containing protein, partial [Telluria sp.]|nr:Plug domain-containing protein [Telluria sp.]